MGKQIRIGNQTVFFAAPVEPFEYAVKSGFNAFEWFPDRHESMGWDAGDIDIRTRSYIKDTALAHDIAMSVHLTLQAFPLRQETRGLLFENIGFAQDIGASLFNVHLYTDGCMEAYVEAVAPVIELSAQAGIKLSIENTPLTGPEDFNKLFVLLQALRKPVAHVGMCLDLGHANLCAETRNDYLGFIDRLDARVPIIHVHLHENYGDQDNHLTVFTGPSGESTEGILGFVQRIKERGFSGNIILEQWPEPPALLNQACDRLYHMLNCREDQ